MILRLNDAIVLLDGGLIGIIDNNNASDNVKRFPSFYIHNQRHRLWLP